MLSPLDGFDVDSFLYHVPEWAHFSKSVYLSNNEFRCKVNFFHARKSAKTDTNRSVSEVFLNPNGPENVTRLKTGTGTSRSTADRHLLDCHYHAFTLDSGEADVQVSVISAMLITVQLKMGQVSVERIVEPMVECPNVLDVIFHL